jgi:hypothetical protein
MNCFFIEILLCLPSNHVQCTLSLVLHISAFFIFYFFDQNFYFLNITIALHFIVKGTTDIFSYVVFLRFLD